jgi:hypothetical protein
MRLLEVLFVLVFVTSCEKSAEVANEAANKSTTKTDESTSDSGFDTTGTLAISDNALAQAYPEGLNISAFSTDLSNASVNQTTGSLSIDYDTTALALTATTAAASCGAMQPQGNCNVDHIAWEQSRQMNDVPYQQIDAFKTPTKTKIEEAKKRMTGQADCIGKETEDLIKYVVEESKNDRLDGTGCYRPDWGIVDGYYEDTNEACMVGFVRDEVNRMRSYVELAQMMVQGMICQAKLSGKADKEIEVGDALSLGSALSSSLTVSGVTLKKADVKRLSNQDTRKRFYSEVLLSIARSTSTGTSVSFDIHTQLTHMPGEKDNTEYEGVLTVDHLMPVAISGQSGSVKKFMSLSYDRSMKNDKVNIKYEMRSGAFPASSDPVGDDGVVNLGGSSSSALLLVDDHPTMCPASGTKPAGCKEPCMNNNVNDQCILQCINNQVNNPTNCRQTCPVGANLINRCFYPPGQNSGGGSGSTTGTSTNTVQNTTTQTSSGSSSANASRVNYISYDGYPDVGAAKMSYWVNFGESYNEVARGFVFDVQLTQGELKGCGIAGATIDQYSIKRHLDETKDIIPLCYLRPFACSDTGGAKVWQQCFKQSTASGLWEIDSDKTPANPGYSQIATSAVDARLSTLPKPPRAPPKIN